MDDGVLQCPSSSLNTVAKKGEETNKENKFFQCSQKHFFMFLALSSLMLSPWERG